MKLRPDGSVKVLDFGLARTSDAPEVNGDSPTLLSAPTQAGMILGTAGYMSPEQARGQAVDKRADIWAFGVVLFEMVTGKRLFEGATVSDSLVAILTKEPDLSAAPVKVRQLIASCLEKDAKNRLRDIGDWKKLLDDGRPLTAKASKLPWAVVAIVTLALAGVSGYFLTRPAPPEMRVDIVTPAGERHGVIRALTRRQQARLYRGH